MQDSRGGFFPLPTLLRGADIVQTQRRPDEGEMRERLRKIAGLSPCSRIVFFREQADIVAQREQALKQGACFGVAALQPVIVGKPKAAWQKNTFSWRQTIDVSLGSIPQDEAVNRELPLDRRDGATHTWIVRRQEADEGYQQQTRVKLAAAEALGEGVALAVESELSSHACGRGVCARIRAVPQT